MAQRGLLRVIDASQLGYWCPGCESTHVLSLRPASPGWDFNGDYDRPTFTPSVFIRVGHYVHGGDAADCYYCRDLKDGAYTPCHVCHSFVTNGSIQFLDDCTHHLRGRTVPMTVAPVR